MEELHYILLNKCGLLKEIANNNFKIIAEIGVEAIEQNGSLPEVAHIEKVLIRMKENRIEPNSVTKFCYSLLLALCHYTIKSLPHPMIT